MRRYNKEERKLKNLKYAVIIAGTVLVALFGTLIYNKNSRAEDMLISKDITNSLNDNTESVSSEIGKNVSEAKNELNNMIENNISNSINVVGNSQNTLNETTKNNNVLKTTSSKNVVVPKKEEAQNKQVQNVSDDKKNAETKKSELKFEKPVEGEIAKEFAMDKLVYSNTLQEWTTHSGVDIKADKATVVKASEAGIVKSIKNDPRYGLTVIVEHENGIQTVYSNLLTSEFVTEGENVKKGQSIGTVGNTAAFEIADEAHLHFEVLKDGIQVDPKIYIEF